MDQNSFFVHLIAKPNNQAYDQLEKQSVIYET